MLWRCQTPDTSWLSFFIYTVPNTCGVMKIDCLTVARTYLENACEIDGHVKVQQSLCGPSSSDDKFWRVRIDIYYHISGKSTDCNGWFWERHGAPERSIFLSLSGSIIAGDTRGKRRERALCPLDATTCGAGLLFHYLLRPRQEELPPAERSDPSRTRPQARSELLTHQRAMCSGQYWCRYRK